MPAPVTIPSILNTWRRGTNMPADAYLEAGSASQPVGLGSAKMLIPELFPHIDVVAFGADPTGTNDSKAAIQAAVNYANSVAQTDNPGGVLFGTTPWIVFPKGIYKTTDTITLGSFKRILGMGAIIKPTANTFPIFDTGSGFLDLLIDGITFVNGLTAIQYDPRSPDAKLVTINNCQFQNQTGPMIGKVAAATVSNGTKILISFCKFISETGIIGANVLDALADEVHLADCWVEVDHTYNVINRGSKLVVTNITHVPTNTNTTFVKNLAGHLYIDHGRFGSENGGCTLVEHLVSADYNNNEQGLQLQITRNEIAPGSHYVVKFYALPNSVIIRDNVGMPANQGLYFDASIPTADIYNLGKNGRTLWDIDQNDERLTMDNSTTALRVLQQVRAESRYPALRVSDVVVNVSANTGGFGGGYTPSNMTVAGPAGDWGYNILQFTSTNDAAYAEVFFNTMLAGLSAGVYTWAVEVEALAANTARITCVIAAGNCIQVVNLSPGKQILHLPFYLNAEPGYNQRCSLSCYAVKTGDSVKVGLVRLLKGNIRVNENRNVMVGSAAPVASPGGGLWYPGDVVVNAGGTNTQGQPQGWQCVFAGGPGVWNEFGQIGVRTSNAAPTVNSYFVGEEFLDNTNNKWYKSVKTGTGAGDWVALN